MIVSPRGTASGPSTVAAAIADNKAVLPFPRATDKAAVVTEGLNASLMNFFCQESGLKYWPASLPWVISRSETYSI